jgi:hypothetical protein
MVMRAGVALNIGRNHKGSPFVIAPMLKMTITMKASIEKNNVLRLIRTVSPATLHPGSAPAILL